LVSAANQSFSASGTLFLKGSTVKKDNKFDYLYVLQGDYGQGWEDLTAAEQTPEGRKSIRTDLKCYRKEEGGTYRVIKRREKITK
jgi:hypothetical protein